ncbi:hypothetical protein GR212_03325 [Rhizobium lusitanum]|uniref:Uncharacterized protein n=1 Tax=Rhizobium lusitanum TaxID=293958 RepID=A0A6L9TYU3_9HYPH|nr:hypothetical protein [Rhizobium lusitanum]NEI68591.1 hypothetical protein [Rhizobium lusitanum]
MSRVRSPGYPSLSLSQAIDFSKKIHAVNRTNAIDREAAAKDMGYSGVTGHSGKIIASLLHYGLLEKAGAGGVRITSRAIDILHPDRVADRKSALYEAAFAPDLFGRLRQRFSDGIPSENSLRSFLVREGFSDVAITPAVSSYLETCRFLQQESAYESSGQEPVLTSATEHTESTSLALIPSETSIAGPVSDYFSIKTNVAERVVFTEEGEPGQYLKLIASGEIDDYLLEALEDFVKRQRKRLTKVA